MRKPREKRSLDITFCGDLAFYGRIETRYLADRRLPLERELLLFLQNTDILIGNLECPLTDTKKPRWHHFKTLKASTKCGEILQTLGLDAVSLANNHIADYGKKGLEDTVKLLEYIGIQWGGAGFTKEEADKPVILERKGYRIGILSLAQPEISAISNLGWGAAVLEAESAIRQMKELKKNTDIAIGYFHQGVEFFHYPTPPQVDLCRNLIRAGAKVIVCHHPHVVQGYEYYNGGLIAYGLGNFLFDMKPVGKTDSRLGAVLRIDFNDVNIKKFEFIPIETANGFTGLLKSEKREKATLFLHELSVPLKKTTELINHDYFTCRDNLIIHLRAFLYYGLLKKNRRKMRDLIQQQRWPQIFDLRKRLVHYMLSGDALRNEKEKSRYPKTVENFFWRGICLIFRLFGIFLFGTINKSWNKVY